MGTGSQEWLNGKSKAAAETGEQLGTGFPLTRTPGVMGKGGNERQLG